jgi:DNA-binding IclR family transcriptional regulator
MEKEVKNKPTYFIQSLDRALNVLECFSLQNKELDLINITKLTGLHRTTATRIINHLENRGYLKYNIETKQFRLGTKLIELGGTALSSVSLRKMAGPYLTQLRDETNCTVLLAIGIEDHYVFIEKIEGKGLIQLATDIGWRRPFSFGAYGFVFMAYMSFEQQENILKKNPLQKYTPKSITERDAFSLCLAQIVEKGYFVEKELFHQDIGGIVAPVMDHKRRVIATLGIAYPAAALDDSLKVEKLAGKVKKIAFETSSEMGYLKI